MRNAVCLLMVLITNSFSIYWFYFIGAKNQWVLDAPGRIMLYEKIVEENGSDVPGNKYLESQIEYLRCDLEDMELEFKSLIKYHPVHESVYYIYEGAITKVCKGGGCICSSEPE